MTAPKCTGHNRRSEPCGNYPIRGATVCGAHGGRAKQVRTKAAERLVEQEARVAFGRLADHSRPVDDPLTALQALAGDVLAWKDFMAGRIAELETLRFEDDRGAEQIRGEMTLFGQALDRCNTVLSTVARLRIDERLATISEKQAGVVIAAIEAALDAIKVPREQRGVAKQAAARALRAVS